MGVIRIFSPKNPRKLLMLMEKFLIVCTCDMRTFLKVFLIQALKKKTARLGGKRARFCTENRDKSLYRLIQKIQQNLCEIRKLVENWLLLKILNVR